MGGATDWIACRARLTPQQTAIVDVATGRRFTYEELNLRASRMAHHLRRIGVQQGDRVALYAPNGPAHVELLFACSKSGAVFVPLNTRFATEELVHVLADSGAKLLLCADEWEERGQELAECVPAVQMVLSLREQRLVVETAVGGSSAPDVDLEAPLAIIYTGGTTGRPKGAVLSHRAVLWNAINTVASWGLTPTDVTAVYLPLFHTGGLNALVTPLLYVGGTVVIGDQWNPTAVLDVLVEERCTIALFVPTMHHMLVTAPAFAEAKLPHMHTMLSGGAPCPPSIYEAYRAKGMAFKEGYGLTEAGPNNFYIHPADAEQRPGSVGMPMLHNEVRLVGDDGQEVPTGVAGELWLRGPHVFSGYWNNVDATAAACTSDGWLRTGDAARRDEDGYHYIVGRLKDLIISGGENVYPQEVETVLDRHPAVSEVAVVGVPDEKWGEAVTAALVLRAGQWVTPDELRSFCLDKLASYKIPKQFHVLAELPKTPVGKLDKRQIANLLRVKNS